MHPLILRRIRPNDCSPCTTYLDQMRQTIRTLGRLTEEDLSEDAKRDLLRTFRDWRKEAP